MSRKYIQPVLFGALCCLLASPGCLEHKVKTTVSADGSCERTIAVNADSGHVPHTAFPLPGDTTWTVRWAKQDSKHEFSWIASKRFPDLPALAADTAIFMQPGKIRITMKAGRSFRWFYTYIEYRETYHRFTPMDRVPPSAVMTDDEIRRVSSGEENDSLKVKVEEWRERNMADLFICTIDTLLQGDTLPPVRPEMVRAHREEIFRNMSHKRDIKETLAEYVPSVRSADLFQDSTFDLTANGLEAMRRLFVKSLGTEAARQLPVGPAWEKTMESFSQAVGSEAQGDFENSITLPGLFLDTNAGKLIGNTATWEFKRDQFELMDFEMHAESRVVNTWAFMVSGVIVAGFLGLLMVPLFRGKRNHLRTSTGTGGI